VEQGTGRPNTGKSPITIKNKIGGGERKEAWGGPIASTRLGRGSEVPPQTAGKNRIKYPYKNGPYMKPQLYPEGRSVGQKGIRTTKKDRPSISRNEKEGRSQHLG